MSFSWFINFIVKLWTNKLLISTTNVHIEANTSNILLAFYILNVEITVVSFIEKKKALES